MLCSLSSALCDSPEDQVDLCIQGAFMQLRRVLIPVIVAGVGVMGVQGTASAQSNNRQNFVIVDDFAEDDIATVLASGAVFSLVGEDTAISETEDLFAFPDGTITVHHA